MTTQPSTACRPLARALFCTALGLALFARVPAAWGDELSDEVDENEAIYAVQGRPILRGHEFSVSLGVLPLDSLYKGVTLGVGYSYHFNAVLGWQLAHFRYSFNTNTGTVRELADKFNVNTTKTPQVNYLLDSNVLFKVLSGKMVLGQNRLAGAEITAIIGPAVAVLSTQDVSFGFDVGLAFRAFLSRHFSASLEVRQYELFQGNPFKVNHVLDVSLGASLNLR